MSLSTNGAARTLGDDREARRAAQTQAIEQPQQRLATAYPDYFFEVFGQRLEARFPRPQVQPRPRIRGLLEGFVKTSQRWRLERGQQGALLGCPDMASAEELLSG